MKVLERALELIAPHICVVCSGGGNAVCNSCQNDIDALLPSSCFLCNTATDEFLTCFSCRKKTPLKHVWRAAEYDELVRAILHAYKFDRVRGVSKHIAQLMADTLPYFHDEPIVTCVPTATSRVRQRGFDHARRIAEDLATEKNWNYRLLLRKTNQLRQVGSSKVQRRKQADSSYRAITQIGTKSPVLLVDDITTTGSTLTAAARELRSAGASEVYAIVLAKKD